MRASTSPNETSLTPASELSYEQAFAELEAIVTILETDQRTLEETLALFERGQELARTCAGQLDQAELKVQQISGGMLTDFGSAPAQP